MKVAVLSLRAMAQAMEFLLPLELYFGAVSASGLGCFPRKVCLEFPKDSRIPWEAPLLFGFNTMIVRESDTHWRNISFALERPILP